MMLLFRLRGELWRRAWPCHKVAGERTQPAFALPNRRTLSAPLRAFTLPRLVKPLLVALAVVIGLPYLLTVVYTVVNPPVSALMLWRLASGYGIDQRWVPLEKISPNLVQ